MHDESQALFGLAGTSNAALDLDEDSKHWGNLMYIEAFYPIYSHSHFLNNHSET